MGFATSIENTRRAIKRQDAVKFFVGGGVVLFLGIAVAASAKKT